MNPVRKRTAEHTKNRLFAYSCGYFLQLWQHTGEDFQSEVLLIPEAVGLPLHGSDLVVEPLDETQGHLVLLVAIRLDAIPVGCDHRGKLLEGFQPLPAQGGTPLLEEPPRPSRPPVVPQLSEGLLVEVGGVQPLVGLEQQLESGLALRLQVPPVRQQRVPLPFDEAPI